MALRKGIKMKIGTSKENKVSMSKQRKTTVKEKAFDLTLEKIAHCIDTRAYYLWEELGRPDNKSKEIWEKAEKEILSKLIKD
jgi:hypothetical protein